MVTPISVRDSLIKQVKEQIIDEEARERYLQYLQKTLHEEYLRILEKEITKAFVSAYEEQRKLCLITILTMLKLMLTRLE